ncbi:transposase [Okeania sp. SIO2B3]|uniref:IS66 family transposase n=1 Tax=Okeania sp. SIO2B3 TaxID=2607784 RepID=UPI0025EA70A1|nr:transposase [Okeania sp. SIO2B3]
MHLNDIEQLQTQLKELQEENQRLKDENNRLKGEQQQPKIKAKKPRGFSQNYSSEKERKQPQNHSKGSKKSQLKIDREEILEYPMELLPMDAQFKGYKEVIIQDISLETDNVLFLKEKYYSRSTRKTYLAELPIGYEGEFGPGIKALIISLYYGANMTQGKLLEFLEDIGISISAGNLSNLLIKNQAVFETEKSEIYEAGLLSSPWQHFDQTGARVGGVNYTANVVCNPLYTVYFTTANKDRLSVLQGLLDGRELEFILNPLTNSLLETLHIPDKWKRSLKLLPQEKVLNSTEFNGLLDRYLPLLGPLQRKRILEAAAIAFYHHQTDWPVIQTLLCDDAPTFKLLTDELALCWIHEGRHYKKLTPKVNYHQKLLEQFLDDFWVTSRDLLAYRDAPTLSTAHRLRSEFSRLFTTESGYQQLDERKRLTATKISELLLVLEHPELPLHNNPAELAARTMVRRRHISYGTQTIEGTASWDTFMSLVATTRKLGPSLF